MNTENSLKNHFLIAMPAMDDPNFVKSVTLICEHNEDGAMGIVINVQAGVNAAELLDHLEISVEPNFCDRPVLAGGPVQVDRGFVIHRPGQIWKSSLVLSDEIAITTSLDVLEAMACNHELDQAVVALGYAGWAAGQLESELANNSWLTVPADPHIIFDTKLEERWQQATRLLGIDISQLSAFGGRA